MNKPVTAQLDDVLLQEKLDAALRELVATRAMLRLSEMRLNIALGMPPAQLERLVRETDAAQPAFQ